MTGHCYFSTMVTMSKKPRPLAALEGNTSKEYWEQVLASEGLSMDAGRDAGHRKVLLVGNSSDLESIYEMLVGDNGKVRPKGTGPDDGDVQNG